MTRRIQKGAAAVLALGAIGLGGSAIANAASATEPVGGPDNDTIQSGDQTTPDVGTKAATASKSSAAASSSSSSEQPGVESSTEAPGNESSSETAPGNDGPGGHADEPGNPQADNQFQGQQ
jgi:threonine dehydrogenase-like Zn-dependent dehydrogenase